MESSLWEEPDYVVKVFLTMLAKKDADFIVRGDLYALAKWANKRDKVDEVLDAIRILSSPDTKKPLVQQDFEGRRIQAVPEGWLILNGHRYREMIKTLGRQEYQRKWIAQKRARLKGNQSGGEQAHLRNVEQFGPEDADRMQEIKDRIEEGPDT